MKMLFSMSFDDNLSETHVFIKLSRSSGLQSRSPDSPTVLCRGWGSSSSFQPEAVSVVMLFNP
jgi:hypothetical protein